MRTSTKLSASPRSTLAYAGYWRRRQLRRTDSTYTGAAFAAIYEKISREFGALALMPPSRPRNRCVSVPGPL